MQSAKNIQAKLFGGGTGASDANQNGSRSATPQPSAGANGGNNNSGNGETPSLQIKIPAPQPPKFPKDKEAAPEPKKIARRSGSTVNLKPYETYQQRLLNKLGTKYDGVERYRLEQDEKRERHWKRWGPYLSERQWVRRVPLSPSRCENNAGHYANFAPL